MRDSWLELVDGVLRPKRARLDWCVREGEAHRLAGRGAAEARSRALGECQGRIEAARAVVFAADDGVIPPTMTDLEREWRTLARADSDAGLMDLWARIAPASWIDRKRWRHSEPEARLDAAVALAGDIEGVEAAESAVGALRAALKAWGTPCGAVVRWRMSEIDADAVSALLGEPERAARAAVSQRFVGSGPFDRAEALHQAVLERASEHLPSRPLLAQSLAHAARVDTLLRASALTDRPNPVTALADIWRAGYALIALDEAGVTLEIPPLA